MSYDLAREIWPDSPSMRFKVRDIEYTIAVLDDGVEGDPTFLLFRDVEEEAIATVHLDPNATCLEPRITITSHIVVRP